MLPRPDRGALFVVTGPSGTGKSTLIRAARQVVPGLTFSVSATTRAARAGEVDGVDYHFLDAEGFDARVEAGDFLEHARVHDRRYGTLRAPVLAALDRGDSVLLDIDMRGARQVKQAMPDSVLVFLLPPSLDALEARLRARATDDEATIQRRLAQVPEQLGAAGEYDYLVLNEDLDAAHRMFQSVLIGELSRRERRQRWLSRALEMARG